MRRNRLRLARPLQHEQLRQDGHTLQPNTESPEHLADLILVGKKQAEDGRTAEEVLDFEGVDVRVVGGFVVVEHEVEGVGLGGEEEDLEGGVPKRAGGEGPEDVCETATALVILALLESARAREDTRTEVACCVDHHI